MLLLVYTFLYNFYFSLYTKSLKTVPLALLNNISRRLLMVTNLGVF